jgi:hypothetical protein
MRSSTAAMHEQPPEPQRYSRQQLALPYSSSAEALKRSDNVFWSLLLSAEGTEGSTYFLF